MAAGLSLASYRAAHGQTTVPITFGKLNGNEFDDKNFAADSGAEAVVLVDYGRTIFDFAPGMYDTYHQLVFQRTTRIKILKKAGYRWATVEIPLFHRGASNERVSNLQATTYNMINGQLVSEALAPTAVFTEEKDENRTLRKFTFPNVKEGSVIEYTYTIKSDFLFNLQDWQFQYPIPVHWSEYRALIPEYYNYKMLLQGYEPLEIQLQEEAVTQAGLSYTPPRSYSDRPIKKIPNGRATKYQWAMKNVPAFRAEPFITSAQDYVARIDFELEGMEIPGLGHENLTETWEKLNTELLSSDHFGGQLSNAGFLKEQLAAITAQHTDLKERAIAIHELTRKSITHNGANGISSAKGLRKAYELHKGSAADVNLLLIALLRAGGLTVDPVILSTRDFGRIKPDFPMITALKNLASTWEASPPEEKWSREAKLIRRFFDHLISEGHRQLPAHTPLASWLHENEARLRDNPYLRNENDLVANLLLPLFQADPQNWTALNYLNLDPSDARTSLSEYLHHWYENAPAEHKDFIANVLAMFRLNDVLPVAMPTASIDQKKLPVSL